MEIFRKAFLISVGFIALAYDELEKSMEEALKALEEQREKISSRFEKQEA